jgi:GntR family histidine utilization transcriptional repressor
MPSAPLPGEPAYSHIKRWVTECIGSGRWREGDQVPSEAELVGLFKVSRMTAHRALRELTAEQLLRRVQGSGTFVAAPKLAATLLAVRSIREEILARGHLHSAEVLVLQRMRLDATGVPLPMRAGSTVFHSRVLHREDGAPIQLEDRWVNPAAAPLYLQQDFSREPPGEYMMRTAPLPRAEYSIEAQSASRPVARLLKLKPGEPCLVLSRTTWSNGLPASFARFFHPGTRYSFAGTIE